MSEENTLVATEHPSAKVKKNKLNRQLALVQYHEFLCDVINGEGCLNVNIGKNSCGSRSLCPCLHGLRDNDRERLPYATEHMWYFHNLSRDWQHQVITQFIRSKDETSHNKRPYQLPVRGRVEDQGTVSDALTTSYPICRNALQRILDCGRIKFGRLQKAAQTNVVQQDWRVGRPSNRALNDVVEEDVHSFFRDMLQLAAPRATRIVQDETGGGVRDQDVELKELPTHFTKRQIYYRYCFERGHKAELQDHKGNIKLTLRAHDDDEENPLWPTGSVVSRIIGWTTFRRFWKRNYGNLVLPNPRQDICGECFILANSFRYKHQPLVRAEDEDSDDDGVVEVQDEDFVERERLISNANKHVSRSVSQRELANEKMAKAIDDKSNNVAHSVRTYTYIADYAQNMDLLHWRLLYQLLRLLLLRLLRLPILAPILARNSCQWTTSSRHNFQTIPK
jgi:hypothetical protein